MLVKECEDNLNILDLSKVVRVPGHSRVDGNEKADELARAVLADISITMYESHKWLGKA